MQHYYYQIRRKIKREKERDKGKEDDSIQLVIKYILKSFEPLQRCQRANLVNQIKL